ncbi:MAG: hypothetical protein KBT33_05505 [Prevotellaceae bacterium]|nr:hypothetical protein [Candidatus Minthosoma equi]
MKRIYTLLALLMTAAITFTGCKDDEPFATATEDDFPQILLPWFGEWENGEPVEYKSITRDTEFVDSCTVTPAKYTTVKWLIDGEEVAEGLRINKYFLAGSYKLQIVATTTKGLTTSRTGILNVRPCDGDPTLAADAKARYCEVGTTKTIAGTNIDGVKHLYINGNEVPCNVVNGTITFDVPEMEDGEYKVVVETDEMKYGCGNVKVSHEKWVDPAIKEVTLWEGEHNVTWGTPFNQLAAQSKELVADGTIGVGTVLRVYVEGEGQGTAASAWWRNILTGYSDDDEGRGDQPISGSMILEYTLNEISIDLINNQDGLFVVGDGYTVKKVTYLTQGGPDVKVLWEGSFSVTWGTPLNEIAAQSKEWVADGTIAVGKVLKVYVEGEGQGTAASAWWRHILTGYSDDDEGRGDQPISGSMVLEYTLNETSIDLINNQDGLFVVGDGYVVTKITIE